DLVQFRNHHETRPERLSCLLADQLLELDGFYTRLLAHQRKNHLQAAVPLANTFVKPRSLNLRFGLLNLRRLDRLLLHDQLKDLGTLDDHRKIARFLLRLAQPLYQIVIKVSIRHRESLDLFVSGASSAALDRFATGEGKRQDVSISYS